MEHLFGAIAAHYSGTLNSYHAFPPASERTAYQKLPKTVQTELLQEGEKYLHFSYPAMLATDFMAFKRTGNRVNYENLYFERRHALLALVLAECIEYKGRFLDDIINGIFLLCEESAWQLPPHNSYLRSEPQYLLPDATRPVLDLFACETGALLAWVPYLLGDALEELSPFVCTRIHQELTDRILTPYLESHFWWMGRENEPMNNWTIWCTQNVLLTIFLSTASSPAGKVYPQDVLSRVFLKASDSCDYFLKEYGEDGCCDEGAQYYRHAGLCLYGCLDVLNAISNGAFSSLYQVKKIRNIATYIMNVHVEDKYYINFADCSPVAGRAGAREYLFAKAIQNRNMMTFAARDFLAGGARLYSGALDQINCYYLLQTSFSYQEILDYPVELPVAYRDIYYPSVGLFLTRSDHMCLAVKAGDNDDSHNHNDTGSFTLYKAGQPVFADIGVESYTQKTFSSRRYEIWTMQSGYHNLPTLMGLDQKDGAAYKASQVQASLEGEQPALTMELASAYPALPGSTSASSAQSLADSGLSYQRTLTLHKKTEQVTLEDHTNCSDVILNFITYEKPVVTASDGQRGTIILGTLAMVSYTGATLLAVETLPITDARLQTAWDHELYRIRLRMVDGDFSMAVE